MENVVHRLADILKQKDLRVIITIDLKHPKQITMESASAKYVL